MLAASTDQNGSLGNIENELAAKQEDIDTALLKLVEKEAIIIRLPAQLKYVEIGGKPEFTAKIGQIRVLPRFVLEPLPDRGYGVTVLPQELVQTAGAMDLFEFRSLPRPKRGRAIAGRRLRAAAVVNAALRFPTPPPGPAHRGWKVRRGQMRVGIA